jgi:squalene-hopene/tetraprenyl-beta-curcumene cyclase
MAPDDYASTPAIQDQLASLGQYLQRRADRDTLFNRTTLLWAATKVPGLLMPAQRDAIIDAAMSSQQNDGGWTMATLGSWKRLDGTPLDTASDGYATGLLTLTLQLSGSPRATAHVQRGLRWLADHQDPSTGMWRASSLNKQRDPSSDAGKFMSDAATAYAVLALTRAKYAEDCRSSGCPAVFRHHRVRSGRS